MSALASTRAAAGKIERRAATIAEVASVTGRTTRAVRFQRDREHWEPGPDRQIEGTVVKTFFPAAEIQLKLMNADLAKPSEGTAPQQRRLLSELDADELKQYEERRAAVTLLEQLQQEGLSKTEAVKIAAKRTGKSKKFFWDWSRQFSKGGLAALIPPKHNKKFGTTSLPEIVRAFITQKYLVERIANASLITEILIREWSKLGVKGDPPSRGTVNTFIYGDKTRGISPAISAPTRTYAHQGPDAYRNQHGPSIIRDHSQIKPMDWWVLDHRILDVDCRNTIFPTLQRDEMYRLHFTAIVDWGSRAWMGFCLSPQASWRTIGSALRMAISDYGFPKNLYWDNGEDFKKVQRMLEGEDQYVEAMRVFLKGNGIEIGITRALKYNARAKQIESMFSGVSKRFDLIWGDAYQGSSTERRSEYNEAAQKRHKKYLAGQSSASPLPADVEVIAALARYLYRENSRLRKSLEGKSRMEVLDATVKESAQPPVARRMLDVLFCERDRRKVGRGACVQLDNRRYESSGDADLIALDFYQGREVVILRDPYCLEEAAALDPETLRFIAELRLQDFVAQSPNGHITRDQIQACLRRERSLKRMYANYVGFYAALAQSQGWKTERQVLLEEAGVLAPTADGYAPPSGVTPGAGEPRKIGASASRPELAPAFTSDVSEPPEDIFNLPLEEEKG